ncbi:hypothetical protein SDC9_203150 [bioreactor metagenome]|uniref:Uncharacterized protein n=1 Tax=bioreactor metagenome TaxID=1076179 RepID=A0A645IVM5_9ZZZZ
MENNQLAGVNGLIHLLFRQPFHIRHFRQGSKGAANGQRGPGDKAGHTAAISRRCFLLAAYFDLIGREMNNSFTIRRQFGQYGLGGKVIISLAGNPGSNAGSAGSRAISGPHQIVKGLGCKKV